MKQFVNGTIFVAMAMVLLVVSLVVILATAGYGIFAVSILEYNGHVGLALGMGFVTLLMMCLEFYFMHKWADWLQSFGL